MNPATKDHLKRTARFYLAILAIPFGIGATKSWVAAAGFVLFLLGVPILAGALMFGSGFFSVRGVQQAREGESRPERTALVLAAPAMLALTLLLALPSLAAGNFVGSWLRLMVNRHHYDAIIEKARSGEQSPRPWSGAFEEYRGIKFVVDRGPPVRVAFNPEGLLDNWSAIIFDPSHQVMLADGFDAAGNFRAPQHVTMLFGGDLVGCRHLWGDYFTCSFT